MSEPPYDPYRRPAQPPHRQPGQPQPGHQQQRQQGQQPYPRDPRDQAGYGAAQRPPAQRPAQQPQQRAPQQQRPAPQRQAAPSKGRGLPGIGVILALVGTLVQVLSLTVLPWASLGADKSASLSALWKDLSNGGAHGFGDWYVLIFSYPLVAMGVLLAFAAVFESAATKVVWAGLMLLGLGYLVLRYGLGPLTGIVGDKSSAMEFSTMEIVVALVAVAAVVIVVFTLRMAVSMFRRVAGIILIGLSGVHITAVMDLVKATDISELDIGAFGPSLGYLLIGIAALIGPRRFIPGL